MTTHPMIEKCAFAAAMYDAHTNRAAITYGDAFTAAIDSILPEEKGG